MEMYVLQKNVRYLKKMWIGRIGPNLGHFCPLCNLGSSR